MSLRNFNNFTAYTGSINYFSEDLVDCESAERLRIRLHSDGDYLGNNNAKSHTLQHVADRVSTVEALETVISKTNRPSAESGVSLAPTDSLYTLFPNEQVQWSQALEVLGIATSDLVESKNNINGLKLFLEQYGHGEKLGLNLIGRTVDCGEDCTSRGFVSLDGFIHPVLTDKCCTVVLIRDIYDKDFGFGVQTIYPGISEAKGDPMKPKDAVRYMDVYNKDLTPLIRQTEQYKTAPLMEKIRLVASARTDLLSEKEMFDVSSLDKRPRIVLDRKCTGTGTNRNFVIHYLLEDGSEINCKIDKKDVSITRLYQNRAVPIFIGGNEREKIYKINYSNMDKDVDRFALAAPKLHGVLREIREIIPQEIEHIRQEQELPKEKSFEDLFFAGHENERRLVEEYEKSKAVQKQTTLPEKSKDNPGFSP